MKHPNAYFCLNFIPIWLSFQTPAYNTVLSCPCSSDLPIHVFGKRALGEKKFIFLDYKDIIWIKKLIFINCLSSWHCAEGILLNLKEDQTRKVWLLSQIYRRDHWGKCFKFVAVFPVFINLSLLCWPAERQLSQQSWQWRTS